MHLSAFLLIISAITGIYCHSIARRDPVQPPYCDGKNGATGPQPGKLCDSSAELDCCASEYNIMHCMPCSESGGLCKAPAKGVWRMDPCGDCAFDCEGMAVQWSSRWRKRPLLADYISVPFIVVLQLYSLVDIMKKRYRLIFSGFKYLIKKCFSHSKKILSNVSFPQLSFFEPEAARFFDVFHCVLYCMAFLQ